VKAPVHRGGNGAPVRLPDVAAVIEDAENGRPLFDRRPAVSRRAVA